MGAPQRAVKDEVTIREDINRKKTFSFRHEKSKGKVKVPVWALGSKITQEIYPFRCFPPKI